MLVNSIIFDGFWTLKLRCTQCGFVDKMAFNNARATIFLKLGRVGNILRLASKEFLIFLLGVASRSHALALIMSSTTSFESS